MIKKHEWYDCRWQINFYSKGELVYSENIRNALVDEGERALLLQFFRSEEAPSTFYARLCNDSLLETDALSDIQNEPSGNGYSAQEIQRSSIGWPTIELDSGDYRLVSKTVTFTASGGNIGPINTLYLATTSDNTGKLIAFVNLSMTRTILNADSATAQIRIKLQ